jgi:dTDP-4-dehydrorhamnose reductase
MRVLVTGAFGMLGHEVVKTCMMCGYEVFATDVAPHKQRLDITDDKEVRSALSTIRPAWVINCAAYTNVDGAEEHEDEAFSLNAEAPGLMARACKDNSVRLLHVSTDYVFDGTKASPYTEQDTPKPINAYGRSKLQGECAIAGQMEEFLIIRSQWLFGLYGKNFVSTIIEAAKGKKSIRVVNDQWGSPTYAIDLSKAMVLLMETEARGIYHVCNRGRATWNNLARKAIALVELETEVLPVSTEEYPLPARRPRYSILSTKKFTKATGRLMPLWQISLKDYVQEYLQHVRI